MRAGCRVVDLSFPLSELWSGVRRRVWAGRRFLLGRVAKRWLTRLQAVLSWLFGFVCIFVLSWLSVSSAYSALADPAGFETGSETRVAGAVGGMSMLRTDASVVVCGPTSEGWVRTASHTVLDDRECRLVYPIVLIMSLSILEDVDLDSI